ncbi:MAG: hypothetical protein OHK0013_42520 [Sandaracinaceae bacterium]
MRLEALTVAVAAVAVSGCCCFGDFRQYMLLERDDAGAMAEARRYYQSPRG